MNPAAILLNLVIATYMQIMTAEANSDSCVENFEIPYGKFFSLNRSCEYNINLKSTDFVDLKMENLYIPKHQKIKLLQKRTLEDLPIDIGELDYRDSGKTRYFRNKRFYGVMIIRADENTVFNASFKPFISERVISLHGANGTILSPYYPHSYLFKHFNYISNIYHMQVPSGHVMLNFTELLLAQESSRVSDRIELYDGNSTSSKRLGKLSSSDSLPALFLSSSNSFTIKFLSFSIANLSDIYRFKAEFKQEIEVNYCKPLLWRHSYAERNVTLPGRSTKYFCKEGYTNGVSSAKLEVTRRCNFSGEWEPGESLKCLRKCPRLDEKLRENSSLVWYYSTLYENIHDGVNARFSCLSYTEDLVGPEIIRCTSHGNYTAMPPKCKKRKPVRGSASPVETMLGNMVLVLVGRCLLFQSFLLY